MENRKVPEVSSRDKEDNPGRVCPDLPFDLASNTSVRTIVIIHKIPRKEDEVLRSEIAISNSCHRKWSISMMPHVSLILLQLAFRYLSFNFQPFLN
jgi:hypothetical protein